MTQRLGICYRNGAQGGGQTLSPEATLVFVILGIAAVLFASGRMRFDVIAMLVVLALMLTGVLTPREALAGFGDPVVVLVAGLLVVGATLTRTGVALDIGRWMMEVGGGSETRLLVILMVGAGLIGSFMSSTAVVAILMPVVLTVSYRSQLNASRLLMPLSFAALVSGMMTLIATTPNLVVSAELAAAGFQPLGFFSFTPIGLAVLGVAVAYMVLVGRYLLPGGAAAPPREPAQTLDDLWRGFGLEGKDHRLRVPGRSPLAGRTLADAGLGTRYRLRVIGLERSLQRGVELLPSPGPDAELHEDDVLLVVGEAADVEAAIAGDRLEPLDLAHEQVQRWQRELGLAVVLVNPDSKLVGRSLREAAFRSAVGLHVLALRRRKDVIADFIDEPLAPGDSLLLLGSWDCIARVQGDTRDFVVLTLPAELEDVAPARSKAPIALAIVAGMVVLSALDVVPVVTAVLLAAIAAVFTGCLDMEEGYQAIHWSSIVLIAGMLPIADALQRTGGVDLLVDALTSALGAAGPYAMMTALFFLTASMGLVLSNTATAVLVAPIAIRSADVLGVSAYPLAMTVAIAASAAFMTPVSTPVVTLVVGPGGYRFTDFLKVGVPMLLLCWLTSLAVIPIFFPF